MPFRNLPGATLCTFKKGEHLISAGDEVQAIFYLSSGVVYRIMTRASGNETIVSRKVGGQGVSSLIGIYILYSEEIPYIAANDFVAYSDCVLSYSGGRLFKLFSGTSTHDGKLIKGFWP